MRDGMTEEVIVLSDSLRLRMTMEGVIGNSLVLVVFVDFMITRESLKVKIVEIGLKDGHDEVEISAG